MQFEQLGDLTHGLNRDVPLRVLHEMQSCSTTARLFGYFGNCARISFRSSSLNTAIFVSLKSGGMNHG